MTLMQRRRALMSPKAGGGLPSEYQQVEYIEIFGSNPLDTGLMLSGELPLSFELGAYRTGGGAYNSYIISVAENTSGNPWLATGITSSKIYARVNNTTKDLITDISCNNKRVDCVFTFSDTGTNSTASINGQQYSGFDNATPTYLAGKKVFVNYWTGNGAIKGRVYYIRIRQQGQLISDLVPCYRISDDAIGMYDVVRRVFCAAPSDWTKGADV